MVRLITALCLALSGSGFAQSAAEEALFENLQKSLNSVHSQCGLETAVFEKHLKEVQTQIQKETAIPGMAPWHGLTVTCENFQDLATEREEEASQYCNAHAPGASSKQRSLVLSRLFENLGKDFQALVNKSNPSCQKLCAQTGTLLTSLFAALEPLSGSDGLGVAFAGKAFFQTVPAVPQAIILNPRKTPRNSTTR